MRQTMHVVLRMLVKVHAFSISNLIDKKINNLKICVYRFLSIPSLTVTYINTSRILCPLQNKNSLTFCQILLEAVIYAK